MRRGGLKAGVWYGPSQREVGGFFVALHRLRKTASIPPDGRLTRTLQYRSRDLQAHAQLSILRSETAITSSLH